MNFCQRKTRVCCFCFGNDCSSGRSFLRLMKETAQELRHVSQFHKRDDLRTYAYSAGFNRWGIE